MVPMNTAPIVSLLVLYGLFFADLMFSVKRLPERVATHFRFNLQADGWMRRSSYLATTILMGLAIPLSLPVLAVTLGAPNGAFVRHAIWFACLALGFLFGIHLLTVRANRQEPAKLSPWFWAWLILFMAGIALWTIGLTGTLRLCALPGGSLKSRAACTVVLIQAGNRLAATARRSS